VYLAFKLGDMFIRETFVYLKEPNTASIMWTVEVVLGVIVPLRMFLSRAVLRSPALLFTASTLVILGVALNRINNFVVAYTPPYSFGTYFPSVGEISVSVGFISLLVLFYRAYVMIFPIISLPETRPATRTKYAIRGGK
jgi:Ni/Fe-hydrogenase subunit HybB-like protein